MSRKGEFYEKLVLSFFERRGCSPLFKNFRSRFGEIDLVVLCRNKLLVVEVKGGKNPHWRIDRLKVKRILLTFEYLLSKHPEFSEYETLFVAAFVDETLKVRLERIEPDDCF